MEVSCNNLMNAHVYFLTLWALQVIFKAQRFVETPYFMCQSPEDKQNSIYILRVTRNLLIYNSILPQQKDNGPYSLVQRFIFSSLWFM